MAYGLWLMEVLSIKSMNYLCILTEYANTYIRYGMYVFLVCVIMITDQFVHKLSVKSRDRLDVRLYIHRPVCIHTNQSYMRSVTYICYGKLVCLVSLYFVYLYASLRMDFSCK